VTLTRSRVAASELAGFCAALRWSDLPAAARERTKELVLDLVGVTLRGSATESGAAVRSFVATQPRGSRRQPNSGNALSSRSARAGSTMSV